MKPTFVGVCSSGASVGFLENLSPFTLSMHLAFTRVLVTVIIDESIYIFQSLSLLIFQLNEVKIIGDARVDGVWVMRCHNYCLRFCVSVEWF